MSWERSRISPGIYHVWEMDDRDQCLVNAIKLRFSEMGREERLALLSPPDHVDTDRRDVLQVAIPETLALEKVRDFFGYGSTRAAFEALFHPRLRAMNQPVFDAMRRRYLRDAGSAGWQRIRGAGRRGGACDGWGLEWLRPDAQVWLEAPATRAGFVLAAEQRGATRSVQRAVQSGEYASLDRQLTELRRQADRLARATQGYREVVAHNAQELQALRMARTLIEYLLATAPASVGAPQRARVENLARLLDECADAAEPLLLSEPPQTPYPAMHGLSHAAREILRIIGDARFGEQLDQLVAQARPFDLDADRPDGLRHMLRLTGGTLSYALRVLLESPARAEIDRALDEHLQPLLSTLARRGGALTPEVRRAIEGWRDVDPAVRAGYLATGGPGAGDEAEQSVVVKLLGLAGTSESVASTALGILERAVPALMSRLLAQGSEVPLGQLGRLGGAAFRALCWVGRVDGAAAARLAQARTVTAIRTEVEGISWGWLGDSLGAKAFSSALNGLALLSSIHDLRQAQGREATRRALEAVWGSASSFGGSVLEVLQTTLTRRGVIADAGLAAAGFGLVRGLFVGAAMTLQARAAAEEMTARDRQGDRLGVFYSGVRMGASLVSAASAAMAWIPVFKPIGQTLELVGVAVDLAAQGADWVTRELRGGAHEVFAKYVNHFGRYAGYADDAEGTNGPFYHLRPFTARDPRVRAFVTAFERVNGLEATPGEAGVSTSFQDGHWGVDLWTPPVDEARLAPLLDAYFTAQDLRKVFDTGTEESWARRIFAHFHGGRSSDFRMGG